MRNARTPKRALVFSVMAIMLCVAMLIGATFAWFTDSASTAANKVQAGTLNIDLLVRGDDGYKSVKADKAAIFNYDKWEPGYTEVKNVMVKTTGNLALKYSVSIATASNTEDALKLAEVIDVYYASSEVNVTDRNLTGLTLIGTLKDFFAAGTVINDTLIPDQGNTEDYATIALKMRESAGNEYQNLSAGDGFDMHVVATQYTHENDSFDDQYDANAKYPVLNAADLKTSIKTRNNVTILGTDTSVPATLYLTQSGKNYLDLNGNTLTSNYTAGSSANKSAVIYYRSPILPKGTLTISGDGSIIGKDGNYAVGVERGIVNITGGTYEGSATAIYAVSTGQVNISGGHFSVRHDPGDMDACQFTINKYDSSTGAKITITGGTFENFNPADNTADGAGTNYVAEGYKVIAENQANGDIWYTVVPE